MLHAIDVQSLIFVILFLFLQEEKNKTAYNIYKLN